MIIAIDFGYSSIKYVVLDGCEFITKEVERWDFGDVFKNLERIRSKYPAIADVRVTGGKSFLLGKREDVNLANELEATCKGALHLAGLDEGLVVNCGTGVSMTYFDGKTVFHMGGTGVGGGTILGLSQLLLKIEKFEEIENLALEGDLSKIDLQVQDIVGKGIGVLPGDITASNFAKLEKQSREDIALGIINLVAETVACIAIPVSDKLKLDRIVLSGRLATSKVFIQNFKKICDLFSKETIQIDDSEFATAVGASL
jgi:type II pantothenate kinase